MEDLTKVSRLVAATLALAVLITFVPGCNRPEFDDLRCESRHVRAARYEGDLASALARQAAANQAYRECIERNGFRWSG